MLLKCYTTASELNLHIFSLVAEIKNAGISLKSSPLIRLAVMVANQMLKNGNVNPKTAQHYVNIHYIYKPTS